jgi:hypothetical protein
VISSTKSCIWPVAAQSDKKASWLLSEDQAGSDAWHGSCRALDTIIRRGAAGCATDARKSLSESSLLDLATAYARCCPSGLITAAGMVRTDERRCSISVMWVFSGSSAGDRLLVANARPSTRLARKNDGQILTARTRAVFAGVEELLSLCNQSSAFALD